MKNTSSIAIRKSERGFTLIELMIGLAIAAVALGAAFIGWAEWNKRNGDAEGKRVTQYLTCAMTNISAPTFVSTTIATLVNKDCFPGATLTGEGTAAASAASPLTGAAYVVSSVNLGGGTNNGLQIATVTVNARNCAAMVSALEKSSVRVIVTPTGGSAVTVKDNGGIANDDAVGIACKTAATATIAAAGSRS
jgi:prepilin-type N-terminal cleavage/methylation domain-containing protein